MPTRASRRGSSPPSICGSACPPCCRPSSSPRSRPPTAPPPFSRRRGSPDFPWPKRGDSSARRRNSPPRPSATTSRRGQQKWRKHAISTVSASSCGSDAFAGGRDALYQWRQPRRFPMIHVCSLARLHDTVAETGALHVVTLLKDTDKVDRPKTIAEANHLILGMDDI